MIGMLIKFWQMTYQTYLDKRIGKIMYYYLLSIFFVIGGLYFYMIWEGSVGFALLFSVWAGLKISTEVPAITIVQAIGMILIVRYSMFGVLDEIAKRPSDKFSERLAVVEEKISDLHKLTFTGMLDSDRKQKILADLKAAKKPAITGVPVKVVK